MDNYNDREELFSTSVKAGKRTYFFDVKKTRTNDYFLTITESKRVFDSDDKATYEKHKIFLYQEDFEKFMEGIGEAVDFVAAENPEFVSRKDSRKDDSETDF